MVVARAANEDSDYIPSGQRDFHRKRGAARIKRASDGSPGVDASLVRALLYATMAGGAIVVGAIAARGFHVRGRSLRKDVLVFLIALGGGALAGAVALVLVPDGLRTTAPLPAAAFFVTGALLFLGLDLAVERLTGNLAQFLAMALDAIPESLALGAAIATGASGGPLLAVLVAVQNLPEGFNAYRELRAAHWRPARAFALLVVVAAFNLVGALAGHTLLGPRPGPLAVVMLIAAGGITYLIFHDIAPKANRAGHWGPTLGSVLGFAIGILGTRL